jgi:hypothetical protein
MQLLRRRDRRDELAHVRGGGVDVDVDDLQADLAGQARLAALPGCGRVERGRPCVGRAEGDGRLAGASQRGKVDQVAQQSKIDEVAEAVVRAVGGPLANGGKF